MRFELRLRTAWQVLLLAIIVALTASFSAGAPAAAGGQGPEKEWERDYSGTGMKIFDIYETDQGYTIIGTKDRKQAFLARLDPGGNTVWEKTLDLRTADDNEVIITAGHYMVDGGYLLGGTVPGYDSYYYIARTDGEGVILWEKEEFSRDYVDFNDIRESGDGGVIYAYNSGRSLSYIVKLGASGEFQWRNELYMTKYDPNASVETVRPTADGGYIAGAFRSGSFILWKLDAMGSSLWTNYYGDGIGWVAPAPNNGLAIFNYERWSNQSVLILIDSKGQQQSKGLGINGTARSIEASRDGGYLIGLSNAVIACDSQGNVVWRKPVSQLNKALPTKDGGAAYISSYEKVVKLQVSASN